MLPRSRAWLTGRFSWRRRPVVVIVIENPGEKTDYEHEDDDEDDSEYAKDRPDITV